MQDQSNSKVYEHNSTRWYKEKHVNEKGFIIVQAKEEHPELTKPQLWKMIGISDSSFKRIMKDLNMKSFYRHEVPVNKKKTDITVNKKIKKGTKKLSSKDGAIANTNEMRGFVSPNDISEVEKAPIINYDNLLSDLLLSV